jgi:thiosulfate/3-mercaptopyruvate sulfurtransferase
MDSVLRNNFRFGRRRNAGRKPMLALRITTTTAYSLARRLYSSNTPVPLVISPVDYRHLPRSVIPIDVSWHMPGSGRDPRAEFFTGKRIPRARFLDLDKAASSHPLNLPHMMPSETLFAQTCRMLK